MVYLRVFWKIVENSTAFYFTYRTAFVIKLILDIAWVGFYLVFIEVLYTHTQFIGSWRKGEVIFLFGFTLMFVGVHDILVRNGWMGFGDTLSRGKFDLIVIKPLSSLFLVSMKRFHTNRLQELLIAGFVVWYANTFLHLVWSFGLVILLIAGVLLSALLYFSLSVFFATILFWSPGADNIFWLHRAMANDIGRYPADIFGRAVRIALFTVIPIALMTNLPVMVVLQKASAWWLVYMAGVTAVALAISIVFYRFGVKHYQSAA